MGSIYVRCMFWYMSSRDLFVIRGAYYCASMKVGGDVRWGASMVPILIKYRYAFRFTEANRARGCQSLAYRERRVRCSVTSSNRHGLGSALELKTKYWKSGKRSTRLLRRPESEH